MSHAELIEEVSSPLDDRGRQAADAVRVWVEQQDPRPLGGVIVIGLHDQGFSIHFMGGEALTAEEVKSHVVWIADEIRGLHQQPAPSVAPPNSKERQVRRAARKAKRP